MLKHLIKYLLFCIKAKYRFGIHSPFVYQLNEYFHNDFEWQNRPKNPFKKGYCNQINLLFIKKIKAFIQNQNHFVVDKIHCIKATPETLKQTLNQYLDPTGILIMEAWFRYRKTWRKKLHKSAFVTIDFYFWIVFLKKNQATQSFLIRLL